MERTRPWQTDAEIESTGAAPRGGAVMALRPAPPEKPYATWGLLGAFAAIFLMETIVRSFYGERVFYEVFTIYASKAEPWDWINRPWSPLVATFSHHPLLLGHILFNSLSLYFFGPNLERLLGLRRYLVFFLAAGILSSIAQAMISQGPALGASGALMGLIGITVVLAPRSKIYFFPLPTPIPLWVAGLIFVLIDLAGAVGGSVGIGNFAHLAGMALGLLYGWRLRRPAPIRQYVAP